MSSPRTNDWLRSIFSMLVLVSTTTFVALGCAAADDHAPTLPADGDAEAPHATVAVGCGTELGCSCDKPGDTTECRAYRKSGDYVACSIGARTCGDDGRWGECLGGDEIAK